MENAQNQPVQPKNIFEAINQNIVEAAQDNVAMFESLVAKFEQMAVKVEQIHAALYPAIQNEIPGDSPKGSGEDEGL